MKVSDFGASSRCELVFVASHRSIICESHSQFRNSITMTMLTQIRYTEVLAFSGGLIAIDFGGGLI